MGIWAYNRKMRTLRLGVVPTIHNEETSTLWCGLIESSCNGNDSQLRGYIYLKDTPVFGVARFLCMKSIFTLRQWRRQNP